MNTRSSQSAVPNRRHHKSLWRMLWVLAFLLHVPATIRIFSVAFGAESGGSGWSSVLFISVTNLFFILEIIFAWSLHLFRSRRSVVAFLVIIALLHVGVIDRAFPDLAREQEIHLWIALSAGAVVIWRMSILLIARLRFAETSCSALSRGSERFRRALLFEPNPILPRPDRGWLSAPLRAPPVLSV
ncbi:MAG: hypothetical protein ACE5EQ_07095 [Phycisphaerae bacterium]